jgi:hypothetical protein
MNNTIKLLLASLIMAGAAAQAEGMPFNIKNEGKNTLHVKIQNPQGQILAGPIEVTAGADYSFRYIPQVVSAHYPNIEGSECGLVLKPDELKDKIVYLRVKPIRRKVGFMMLKGVENNISIKSIRDAKKAYQDWKKEQEKPLTVEKATVEAVITTTPTSPCSMCTK